MDAKAAHSPGMIKFLAWFEVNKKRVLIGALVAAVLGLVIGLAIYYQSQREVRASEALSEIKIPLGTAAVPPGTAFAYQKVARDHRGTQAAGRALLLAGTTLFVQADYDEARKMFEQFAREYPASPFVPEALFGIASVLDAQKKPNDAIAKFEELRRRYGKSSVMDETKLKLARLYEEQNKPAQALDLYDELVKANQYSGIGSEAGLRMEVLLTEHPELKKTNAPIITPPPMRPNTNVVVQRMTNRPSVTMTNRVRMTSNVPTITTTNKTGATGTSGPIKLNIGAKPQ
jgi:tetratricopeptide (TPR) repeat protein